MMSPFVHFFLSLLVALSMNLKYERKYLVILFLGFMGVLPDIDHLFPLQISGTEVYIFHNLNFLVLLPLALLLFICMFESFKGGHSSKYQRFAFAMLIILSGHLVLDIVAGNTIILQFSPEIIEFSLQERIYDKKHVYKVLQQLREKFVLLLGHQPHFQESLNNFLLLPLLHSKVSHH